MAKSRDARKDVKKKSQKSIQEKRKAKQARKRYPAACGFSDLSTSQCMKQSRGSQLVTQDDNINRRQNDQCTTSNCPVGQSHHWALADCYYYYWRLSSCGTVNYGERGGCHSAVTGNVKNEGPTKFLIDHAAILDIKTKKARLMQMSTKDLQTSSVA
jgi:hypothetical protein